MLDRFYDIMEHFKDDMRLAAFALAEIKHRSDPLKIYNNLLGGIYKDYLGDLEDIIDNYEDLEEFCNSREFILDMANSSTWSIGDLKTIEYRGWKFLEKEDDGESII